ncbi:unnamed protein product [Choristocarpus tenellus]
MSPDDMKELYLASFRAPLIVIVFLGLWGLVMLILQALRIDYESVLIPKPGRLVCAPRLPLPSTAGNGVVGATSTQMPLWIQVLMMASALLACLLMCIYTTQSWTLTPTAGIGGFYMVLGVGLLMLLQSSAVK